MFSSILKDLNLGPVSWVTVRQGPVVELLTQWKASIDPDQAAGALCDAAAW